LFAIRGQRAVPICGMPPELPEQMRAHAATAPAAAYPDVWRSGRRRRARDDLWRLLPGTVRFSRTENLLCQVEFCVARQPRRPFTVRSHTHTDKAQRGRAAVVVSSRGRRLWLHGRADVRGRWSRRCSTVGRTHCCGLRPITCW
jgi:hypothetical protein